MRTAAQGLPAAWPPADGDHRFSTGLLLRVRGNACSWVLRYTAIDGRRREMGLGVADLDSPESLQRQADVMKAKATELREIVAAGRDPIDERNTAKSEARMVRIKAKGLTTRRALRIWYDSNEHRWSTRYAQYTARQIENDPPAWLLETPVEDLTSTLVIKALAEMTVPQARIDLMRQRLDWVMEMFMHHGTIPANPAGVRRIVRGRFKGGAR